MPTELLVSIQKQTIQTTKQCWFLFPQWLICCKYALNVHSSHKLPIILQISAHKTHKTPPNSHTPTTYSWSTYSHSSWNKWLLELRKLIILQIWPQGKWMKLVWDPTKWCYLMFSASPCRNKKPSTIYIPTKSCYSPPDNPKRTLTCICIVSPQTRHQGHPSTSRHCHKNDVTIDRHNHEHFIATTLIWRSSWPSLSSTTKFRWEGKAHESGMDLLWISDILHIEREGEPIIHLWLLVQRHELTLTLTFSAISEGTLFLAIGYQSTCVILSNFLHIYVHYFIWILHSCLNGALAHICGLSLLHAIKKFFFKKKSFLIFFNFFMSRPMDSV